MKGSKFFRELMMFYNLRLHDISLNSMLHVSAFTFLYEAYLNAEPSKGLWLETFANKQQAETKGGPPVELGAVSFQCRPRAPYLKPRFLKKVSGWTKMLFYVKNTMPAHQASFRPFTMSRLIAQKDRLMSKAGSAEVGYTKALQAKITILIHRGL
jgi:hypothetical protein